MVAKKLAERAILDAFLKRHLKEDITTAISIEDSAKPDFIILVAGQTVGVEVTRSSAEEYVRALKLQACQHPSAWLNTTHLKDRSVRRTNDALARTMGVGGLLQPWEPVGAFMRRWGQEIGGSLFSKRKILNTPGYQIFDKNWLLIHDEPPLPNYESHRALAERELNELFRERPSFGRDFDTVFVHSGEYLFCWDGGELLRSCHEICAE